MAADVRPHDLVGATRLPARRQSSAAGGDRRRRGRAAAFRPRPGAAALGRVRPPGLAVRRAACPRHRPARGGRSGPQRRPRQARATPCCGWPGRCGARQVHVSADFAPYGRARDEARVDGPRPARRSSCRRTGSPVRGGAGHADQRLRRPVPGVQPLPSGLGRARRARSGTRRTRRLGRLVDGRRSDDAREARPRAGRPGRREAGSEGLAGVAGRGLRGGRRTTPSCTTFPARTPPRTCPSRCAGGTCTRVRCWPTWLPLRSKGALALARQIAWRDFFADVCSTVPTR